MIYQDQDIKVWTEDREGGTYFCMEEWPWNGRLWCIPVEEAIETIRLRREWHDVRALHTCLAGMVYHYYVWSYLYGLSEEFVDWIAA